MYYQIDHNTKKRSILFLGSDIIETLLFAIPYMSSEYNINFEGIYVTYERKYHIDQVIGFDLNNELDLFADWISDEEKIHNIIIKYTMLD